ncbi:hypothetical protein FAZ19_06375 [Sphingobacterium alkalisoli]|uniref:Uncharacterized protein n=1 Tax=Sphingobacterium alkalisoli TaxID=1874115 RepID=A0A4U0H4D7_9SPHI|nr:hypothetical protein [Sphingobacterium alkalisoli]TJY66545.1 hypothetical protein FAZ19_06375 [Sphingobacterium alkalisoli]GGH15720.1 hypothetical protein GCM10011418_17640 [Sphingobacterium alkalisoli]
MNKFIKTQFLAIAAVVTILGFSAFKMVDRGTKTLLAPVTIYFHGDSTDPSEVQDESFWTDQPNGQPCNTGTNNACAMIVEDSDLIPNPADPSERELNPTAFQLGAQETTSGNYVPTKTGGSSSTPLNSQNRN